MMNQHLKNLLHRCPELIPCTADLEKAYGLLSDCLRAGKTVWLCGNGGSAADCEHWAGEMLKGFGSKRPLSAAEKAALPSPLAAQLQGGLAVIPLTGFTALSTAVINDIAGDLVFAQLLWALGRPGDLLVGISTSGNAPNVRHAMSVAQAKGIRRLGLSGQSGGELKKELSDPTDLCLCVPQVETYRIQELHLPIYHCLSLMLEEEFFGEKK
jgi:D-sedoheptulose 7-phosphate isomerase